MRKEHTWCWPVEPEERWDIDTPWLAARPWKPHRFIPPWKPFPILWGNEQHKCWNQMIVHTYWLTHPHIGRGQNVSQTVSFLCTWDSEDRLCDWWPTDRHESIWCHRKFFDNPLWRYSSFFEMTSHLECCCSLWFIRGGNLYSMIYRMVASHSTNIGCHLAILNLQMFDDWEHGKARGK